MTLQLLPVLFKVLTFASQSEQENWEHLSLPDLLSNIHVICKRNRLQGYNYCSNALYLVWE